MSKTKSKSETVQRYGEIADELEDLYYDKDELEVELENVDDPESDEEISEQIEEIEGEIGKLEEERDSLDKG